MSHPPGDTEREDRELLQRHVDGDPDAFTELVRRHRDRLWAVALRTLGDREEAADALQDALLSAFRNAASYRGEAAVTTWLHRVVVNACLDRVRRRRARPGEPLGEREVPSGRDDHGRTELRIDVRNALAALPEGQRIAIVLVDLEDMPIAEVASLLGVAEGTVKSRCFRGRITLAALLHPSTGSTARSRGNRSARSRVAPTETPAEGMSDSATAGGGGP